MPYYRDHCRHGKSCFIKSFDVDGNKYDLYVFKNGYGKDEVCIRYGNESHEYISPGDLNDFLNRERTYLELDSMINYKASRLLKAKGYKPVPYPVICYGCGIKIPGRFSGKKYPSEICPDCVAELELEHNTALTNEDPILEENLEPDTLGACPN